MSRIAETSIAAAAALICFWICLWLDTVFVVLRGVELCAELDGST